MTSSRTSASSSLGCWSPSSTTRGQISSSGLSSRLSPVTEVLKFCAMPQHPAVLEAQQMTPDPSTHSGAWDERRFSNLTRGVPIVAMPLMPSHWAQGRCELLDHPSEIVMMRSVTSPSTLTASEDDRRVGVGHHAGSGPREPRGGCYPPFRRCRRTRERHDGGDERSRV